MFLISNYERKTSKRYYQTREYNNILIETGELPLAQWFADRSNIFDSLIKPQLLRYKKKSKVFFSRRNFIFQIGFYDYETGLESMSTQVFPSSMKLNISNIRKYFTSYMFSLKRYLLEKLLITYINLNFYERKKQIYPSAKVKTAR